MNNLITINELTARAETTKIHIAYLTKLGLLPNAVKRKINGFLTGCYPEDSINRLIEIEHLKKQGLTYSQMSHPELVSGSVQMLKPVQHDIAIHIKPSNFIYLFLGLIVGVLLANLNTRLTPASSISADNFALGEKVKLYEYINSQQNQSKDPIYVISLPEQNLDKIDKTNINYLIRN